MMISVHVFTAPNPSVGFEMCVLMNDVCDYMYNHETNKLHVKSENAVEAKAIMESHGLPSFCKAIEMDIGDFDLAHGIEETDENPEDMD